MAGETKRQSRHLPNAAALAVLVDTCRSDIKDRVARTDRKAGRRGACGSVRASDDRRRRSRL